MSETTRVRLRVASGAVVPAGRAAEPGPGPSGQRGEAAAHHRGRPELNLIMYVRPQNWEKKGNSAVNHIKFFIFDSKLCQKIQIHVVFTTMG